MQIADKYQALKTRYAERDGRMADILAVRKGNMESVFPDLFPEGMSKPMVANFVEVAARDLAEVMSPLPSVNCSAGIASSDRAKAQADKRTMIANHYLNHARFDRQMLTGADWYISYAHMPVQIVADEEARMPRPIVVDPIGLYPEFDRFGRLTSVAKKYAKTLRQLIVDFPELETQILGQYGRDGQDMNALTEMVRYEDAEQIVLFLPQRQNLVLARDANPMGKVMWRVARRPGIDMDDPRGQFDDVLYVQMARARFAMLAMEAAEKSVYAPLVVPNDIDEFAYGPDAMIRTNNPAGVRKVGLELPQAAFLEQRALEEEMRLGARYPEGRSGSVDASIITGQGVQALLGGFDTQVKAAQTIFADLIEEVIGLCFEMDEVLFPGPKEAEGVFQGSPYQISYDPVKDINGNYSVQVRYGLMAGLDPSRALIFSLQALQANLVSEDFVRRELPWSMNVAREQEQIDIEAMRKALAASVQGLSQAIPQFVASGQDPTKIIQGIASVIEQRRAGKSIEAAVAEAFKPEPPPETAPVGPEPVAAEQPTENAAPEQAAAGATPPQGPPDLASIMARLGGGGA
jgi:hypothetical protein